MRQEEDDDGRLALDEVDRSRVDASALGREQALESYSVAQHLLGSNFRVSDPLSSALLSRARLMQGPREQSKQIQDRLSGFLAGSLSEHVAAERP